MTEVHAALGLANLKYYEDVLVDRKVKYNLYTNALSSVKKLRFQIVHDGNPNYSYFPIIFQSEGDLLQAEKKLNEKNIYSRRYFYPSVNTYQRVVDYQPAPVSEEISRKVMCLPLYWKQSEENINRIIESLVNS